MATTSLKLPDELKQRTITAAEQQGVSPHAFMVSAIEQAAHAAEQRSRFVADALAAEQEVLESGNAFDAGDVHTYIKARLSGENPERPPLKPWRS
jgi:predicted transcriptional regulator